MYQSRKWGQIGNFGARSVMFTKKDGMRSRKADRI